VNVHGLIGLGLAATLCAAACKKSERPSPPVSCKVKNRVEKDTTFYKACSPYTIRGGIDVLGKATLTIEAGVEVRFRDKDWLEIAAAGTRGGRLVARGTPEEPIILTSESPETASSKTWFGLWFNAGTGSGSVLANAVIRYAGGLNRHIKPPLVQGCLTFTDVADGAVTIENVTVEHCLNAGVVLRRSRPALNGLSVKNALVGFLLDGAPRDAVPAGASFADVAQEVVEGPTSR
jgi:hypothetical protein